MGNNLIIKTTHSVRHGYVISSLPAFMGRSLGTRLDMNTLELDPSYHPSYHTMHIHMLGQYKVKIVTYFRVSKLWFTLRASASAVVPESPT